MPPATGYGIWAFHSIEDALRCYMELRSPLNTCAIWTIHTTHKWYLSQVVEERMKLKWPDDVEILVDYVLVGEQDVVEPMKRYAEVIFNNHP